MGLISQHLQTHFFLELRGGGGGGAGGGAGRPLLPSFRGRPRGRLSWAGLLCAALASWALRPARVMREGGPLSRGSWGWASDGILRDEKANPWLNTREVGPLDKTMFSGKLLLLLATLRGTKWNICAGWQLLKPISINLRYKTNNHLDFFSLSPKSNTTNKNWGIKNTEIRGWGHLTMEEPW